MRLSRPLQTNAIFKSTWRIKHSLHSPLAHCQERASESLFTQSNVSSVLAETLDYKWKNPVNPSQPDRFRKQLYSRHWPRLNPSSFPQPCAHWSRSPGGADLRSAVLLHLQIFISRADPGTAWHCKHSSMRGEIVHVSRLFALSLLSLSLCPFSSPSCQISIHYKHWLFPPSYSLVSPTRLLRRPRQCVVVLTAALEIDGMWVYAREDGWVQAGFSIKPKALPLGCLSTSLLLGLILYPSSADLFVFSLCS